VRSERVISTPCDEVHAVLERGDQHDVGGQVERNQFIKGQILVEVVDGRVTDEACSPFTSLTRALQVVTLCS